jgi:vacuolar-type H+-ATPase subunit I/STV1
MSVQDVLTRLGQIEDAIKALDDRVKHLEEQQKSSVSPYMQSVSEAEEKTLAIVRELTEGKEKWARIEAVARRTGRSPPTESGYLRYLYGLKRLDRRSIIVGTGKDRRRILEYRAKA